MKRVNLPPLKTRDDFVNWLFGEFKVPESKQIEIKKRYDTMPEICDFNYLAVYVLEKYISRDTLPGPKLLMYQFVEREKEQKKKNHIPVTFGNTCEAIKAKKESRAFFEANFDACQDAMRECMAKYEAISGRKLRRTG